MEELAERFVDHDQWLGKRSKKGLAQLDRGEFIEHDEIVAVSRRCFTRDGSPLLTASQI